MKFNTKKSKTMLNHEGAIAYQLSPEMELYTAVVTSALQGNFYESEGDRIKRLQKLIQEVDPLFTAKLAVYAREKMNLRSVPLVLIVELAKIHNGDSLVSKTISKTVRRADEITELLAYYQHSNLRTKTKKLNKLSKQVQKGLIESFNSFDEYQFAKYNRKADVTLKDALFLVHPRAKDGGQQVIFDKIINDNLTVPYTWEVELSTLGQEKFDHETQKADAFRSKWEELIDSNRLGYMALLRNLRNILEIGVSPDHLKKVADRLSSADEVRKSKQLPFRFLSAYREVLKLSNSKTSYIIEALEKAVLASAENIQGFDLNTEVLIACDVSGSMQHPVSRKSSVLLYDIGLLLGMLLQSKCLAVTTGIFGDKWKRISLPGKSILNNVQALYKREGEVGYSTNGYLVLKELVKKKEKVDKVMMFTDLQLWDSNNGYYTGSEHVKDYWKKYKKIAPEAKLYLFDLAGYGNTPLSVERDDVYLIAGWSDKIFDVLVALENGEGALSMINKVEL